MEPQVLEYAATHATPPPPPVTDSLGVEHKPRNDHKQSRACWQRGLRDHWRRMETEYLTEFADDQARANQHTSDEIADASAGRQKAKTTPPACCLRLAA